MANDNTFSKQYMLNYFDALRLLRREQEALGRAAVSAKLSDGERAEAAAAYLDISSEIAEFEDVHRALMQRFTMAGVPPPGPALVQATGDLLASLGAQLAQQNSYRAILQSVTGLIGAWAGLIPGSGDADAGAGNAVTGTTPHLAFIGNDNPSP